MIKKIEAKDRYRAEHDWLTSYHLFSFADYYDPENMNFGVLRVFNDDMIDAHNGFGKHGHRDMEIITIVLSGELTHEDTLGNKRIIKEGEVQYMSAGMGVMHSEINRTQKPVHLYQIWLSPTSTGLMPRYNQKDFSGKEKNKLIPVASGIEREGVLHIRARAAVSLCALEDAKTIAFPLPEVWGMFIYISKGSLSINGVLFESGDQARIHREINLTLTAQGATEFVLVGMDRV